VLFSTRIGRVSAGAALTIVMLGASGSAILCVTHPAAAEALIAAVTTVTCSVTGTNYCIAGKNTSSGIGVLGSSNSGTGVRGTANSNYGIKGSSGSSDGVYGATTSGLAGVAGSAPTYYGVYGYNTGDSGIAGVYGESTGGYGVTGFSGDTYGVFGQSDANVGVAGTAYSGDGVYGYTTTSSGGTGVLGSSYNGFGVEGTTSSGTGIGINGYESSSGIGVLGSSGTGYGVLGRSSEDPLVAENNSGTVVAFVNSEGDFYYMGGLHNFAHIANGATVTSFTPRTAAPTVEDTGTAQLVGGTAAVRLDPTFAASIDLTTAYRVFITPDGDIPHPLFVAAKTATGFIVREAQAGRSTVSFDYRIVATALGQTGQRMAATNPAAIPHLALPAGIVPRLPLTKVIPSSIKPPPSP
jgi:hypothetical protein